MSRTSNSGQKILEYVERFVRENGYAPSVREIGEGVGLRSTATVNYHLRQLQSQGLLKAPDKKGQKRAAVPRTFPGQIPVLPNPPGKAGLGAIETPERFLPWQDSSCFAFPVPEQAMAGWGIFPGDLAVVQPESQPAAGQLTAIYFQGRFRVRRWSPEADAFLPSDPAFGGISRNRCRILGCVVGLVRQFDLPFPPQAHLSARDEK